MSDDTTSYSDTSLSPNSPDTNTPNELVVRVCDMTLKELYCGKEFTWPSETQSVCSRCAGKGKILQPFSYRSNSDCYACSGTGTRIIVRNVKIPIPPGTEDGYEKLVKNMGWPPKDVLLKVREMAHPFLKRKGADLFMCLRITLKEALCGFQRPFNTLDGREILLTSSHGMIVTNGSVKCVDQEGFPLKERLGYRGKLYIQLLVDLPLLTKEVAQKVAIILRGEKEEESFPVDAEEILLPSF